MSLAGLGGVHAMTGWLSPGSCSCGPCPQHGPPEITPERVLKMVKKILHCGLCGTCYAGETCPGCKGDIFGESL